MTNMTRGNQPSRNLSPWRDFFDSDLFGAGLAQMRSSMPAVNLSENENSYDVELVARGYRKDDFTLKVNDDVLTISAESKNERTEGTDGREYSRREYTCNSFTRSFQLPDNVKEDGIAAKYSDGILRISIPKSKKEMRASKDIRVE